MKTKLQKLIEKHRILIPGGEGIINPIYIMSGRELQRIIDEACKEQKETCVRSLVSESLNPTRTNVNIIYNAPQPKTGIKL